MDGSTADESAALSTLCSADLDIRLGIRCAAEVIQVVYPSHPEGRQTLGSCEADLSFPNESRRLAAESRT